MSIFARDLGIDLSFLSHQGAYMSSSTFTCIEQYFQPIELPPHSAYHLIGMHNPQLMAKCRVEPILAAFLKASSNCKNNLIIDLSLPYHDEHCSNRTFQGRYIIYDGVLLGVKLNTAMGKVGSAYSPWPRHRAKQVELKLMGKESSLIIGDISVYLLNARIGLLFQSQLHTSAQEYLNQGFDILALAYESIIIEHSTIQKKSDLSRQIILLESEIGSFSRPIPKAAIDSMLYEAQSPLVRQRNTIYMQYYDLNKTISFKNRQYFSENQANLITPIQINLALTQHQVKIEHLQSQASYQLMFQAYSLQNPQSNDESDFLSIFYRRLFLFSIRTSSKKIVIILEDSPYILCFLYLLESIIMRQKSRRDGLALSHKFKFIQLPNAQNKIFHKFKFLNMQRTWESLCENESNTGHLVRTLDHISAHQKRQNYFILVTADRQVKVVVEMLNNREMVKLEKGQGEEEAKEDDSSLQCLSKNNNTLKTWIATNFFSSKELKELYFSRQFKAFFADQQQHANIWKKFVKLQYSPQRAADLSIDRMEISSIKQPLKIQDLLLRNHHLQLQFQSHYSKVVKANVQISKTQLFSHFLFRKVASIDFYTDQENQQNIFIQLLTTDEHNIKRNFNFLTRHALSTYQKLLQRVKLNAIASERASSQKLTCHFCEGQFSYQVMYLCQFAECKESFCYQCLFNFKCFQDKALLKESSYYPIGIKLCPVCRGLCKDCNKCKSRRINLTKQSKRCVNTNFQRCHYCRQSNSLYSYQCSNTDCQRYFCIGCIEQCYRVRTKEYEHSSWKCFVCSHRCYCNQCEGQKAKILSLRLLSSQAATREKKSASRKSCLRKFIQIKDSDCSIIQIDENNAKSTVELQPKSHYHNESTSTIYNEETHYRSPSKPTSAKPIREKPRPLASPQMTRQQPQNRRRRHGSHKKLQNSYQSQPRSPPPNKKIKTTPRKSSLKSPQ